MNRWEIEVQQSLLDSEEDALKELERQYEKALKDINEKVKLFQADIDILDQAISQDGLDDAMKAQLLSQRRSKIYQQNYQKALQGQISGILDKMHGDNYATIDSYLKNCYETGFIGTMYDIAHQGIPIIAPIDQAAAVKAILTDSKVSNGLYSALGVDVANLKKTITQEISRGIATSMAYRDIARNISNVSGAPLSRAKTITRTEGHRIQQTSTVNAQQVAKARGADVVKQWDASLDGKTRDSHRRVDGEIRELDEKFSNGLMFPGDPSGEAAEVVNCRCTSNTRAKWALDEDELQTLKDRAEFFGLDKSKDFEDFQKKYLTASANIEKNLENTAFYGKIGVKKDVVFSEDGKPYEIELSREKKKEIIARGISEVKPIFATDTTSNKFATYVSCVKPKEGFFDVALHGRDTSVEFFGETIDAYTLSQIIRQRKDYTQGTKIRLLSCNVGNTSNTGDCVAQIVANELGVIVEAPTDVLFISFEGEITIGKRNSGKMELFYPRK